MDDEKQEYFYVGMGSEGTARRAAIKLLQHMQEYFDLSLQVMGCEFMNNNGEWFLYLEEIAQKIYKGLINDRYMDMRGTIINN